MAADASPRAVEKIEKLARARGVPVVQVGAAAALGARLGRPPVMVAGVRDRKLADGLLAAGQPDKQ
jgi:ribosomal protein L7Ae-like RNA K-turn-binding protein